MRLHRDDIPFTMVANDILRDETLSLKAKGMYAYLFSKPDEWDFSAERIMKESTDGRHAVLAALKELEDAGYLERERQASGRVDYHIKYSTQSPKTELRLFEEGPKVGKSHSGKTQSRVSRPVSNTVLSNTVSERKIDSGPFSLQEEIKKLEDNHRRDLNIVALYFEERKPKFESRAQFMVALRRHLRAASMLKPFSDQQIVAAARKAKQDYPEWTLETVVKLVTK